eukprot:1066572-Pleurochrysis_carterae.AAC.1
MALVDCISPLSRTLAAYLRATSTTGSHNARIPAGFGGAGWRTAPVRSHALVSIPAFSHGYASAL